MEQWIKLQADCSNFEDVWYLPLDNHIKFRYSYRSAIIHHNLMDDKFTLDIKVTSRCMGGSYYGIPLEAKSLHEAKLEAEKWCTLGYFTIRRMLREMVEGVSVESEDQSENGSIQLE